MYRLVLLRHGESTWNKKNLFTGWTDVGLTKLGREQAVIAGKILKEKKFLFDQAYTSVLKRAKLTTKLVINELGNTPEVSYSWRLNERHYGALQGLNKSAIAKKYGEKKVFEWRRSYNTKPPELKISDNRHPKNDLLYKYISRKDLPSAESLKDTVQRVMPLWKEIMIEIKSGKKIIISAHGNSLRALIKSLDKLSAKEITKVNIPTGIPLIYELNSQLKPIRNYYLASKKELNNVLGKVKKQGKINR